MADNKQDGIAVFDTLFTNNRICMMKIVLPFLPPSFQKSIAIYIKYLELQYTMQYFAKHPLGIFSGQNATESQTLDPDTMWENILPYCTPAEKEKVKQMRDMMQTFNSMKDMMEMLETMKELFPEGFTSPEGMSEMFSGGFGVPENFSNLFNINKAKGE